MLAPFNKDVIVVNDYVVDPQAEMMNQEGEEELVLRVERHAHLDCIDGRCTVVCI